MDIYRENILDHYKHPRNFGVIEHPDGSAEQSNTTCGDRIRIDLEFTDHGGKRMVGNVRFSGTGCAISQASASLLTEHIIGKTLEEVRSLGLTDILDMLGTDLTPARVRCAALPLEVLSKITADARP